jgi:hypothetical protein
LVCCTPISCLQVRWPAAGNLLVPPLCGASDGAGNCYAHRPDFVSGAGGDSSVNTCGSAAINSSHIAAYTQCATRGSCEKFPGEEAMGVRVGDASSSMWRWRLYSWLCQMPCRTAGVGLMQFVAFAHVFKRCNHSHATALSAHRSPLAMSLDLLTPLHSVSAALCAACQ